ncbi:MAG: hypothetical protein PHV30_09365 [Candidatus Margulisbacteria bacterium]|nr:hypothetical protein [Candidatus Margulisiibacteriota bacterium]
MKLKISLFFVLVFAATAAALNYGDGFMYPRLSKNLKEYYEINLSYAYFSQSNTYKLFDSAQFLYNFTDDLSFALQKKYVSDKLTMELQYRYLLDVDWGEIGLGIRNLGMNFADTNSPYPQEYAIYGFDFNNIKINLGLERVINNGSDLFVVFGGAETKIMENVNLYTFYDYGIIGAGLGFPWSDQIRVNVSAYGMSPGVTVGDYKVLELGFTLLNFGKSGKAVEQNVYAGNKLTSEALTRLKNQEKQINNVTAKINAMEYLYSEQFQKKLVNEIVQQKIVEQNLREDQTLLLKTTLKHIQKGLEYYYLHDLEKAYQEYKMANSLYPNMPVIHESLGSIYYKLGHFDQAKEEWLLTLSLEPENQEARTQLENLKKEHPELFQVGESKK